MKILSLTLALVLWASVIWASTYYIDPTCASSGNGATKDCGVNGPFKTWAEVIWRPGNTYSQKGGTTAHESITVCASGTAQKPIILNSYGHGNANLDGAVKIPPNKWANYNVQKGIYKSTYKPPGMGVGQLEYAVLEDGVILKAVSKGTCTVSEAFGCTGAGKPFSCCKSDASGANILNDRSAAVTYYKPSSGGAPSNNVKHPSRAAINIGSKSHISITGFNITNYIYGVYGVVTKGKANSYITIKDNYIHNQFSGIWLELWDAKSTGITIANNTIDYVRMSIELQVHNDCNRSGGGARGDFDNVTIAQNTITHGNLIEGVGQRYTWEDVNLLDWDEEGLGFQSLSNSSVYNNNISGRIRGVVLFVCEGTNAINNKFYNNRIDTYRIPFYLQPTEYDPPALEVSGNTIYNNVLIHHKGEYPYSPFAAGGRAATSPKAFNKLYNNTIISNNSGLSFLGGAGYWKVKNNIIYNVSNMMVWHQEKASNIIYASNLYSSVYTWNGWSMAGTLLSWGEWTHTGANYESSPKLYSQSNPPSQEVKVFSDPGDGDYSLAFTSPAKYNGVRIEGLSKDHLGNLYHNPPSLGAYEFTVVVPGLFQLLNEKD